MLLPADAASLRETGSVDRYTPPGPMRGPSNSIASCDAMCCIKALTDSAEGLHFSSIISSALSSVIQLKDHTERGTFVWWEDLPTGWVEWRYS